MKTTLTSVMTFVAAAAVGCGAAIAIAIASTATLTHASMLRPASVKSVPQEVIRLEPVVVTISKTGFEAVRKQMQDDTQMARNLDSRRANRG